MFDSLQWVDIVFGEAFLFSCTYSNSSIIRPGCLSTQFCLLIHRVITLSPKSPFNKENRWQTALQQVAGLHIIFNRSLWCQENNLHRKVGLFVHIQDSFTGHGVKPSLDLKLHKSQQGYSFDLLQWCGVHKNKQTIKPLQ